MPTGRVKRYDEARRFGFIAADEGNLVYIHGDRIVEGNELKPGDIVEFELESDGGRRPAAKEIRVTLPAPAGRPVGLVSGPPPTWDKLEDLAREERQRRRGRRR